MRFVWIVAATAMLAGAALAEENDGSVAKRVSADPLGEVEISNVAGAVEVNAWDRPEVEVRGEIDEGVERVDVVSDGKRTLVKVVVRRNSRADAEAMLQVRVPATSELEVSTVSADITAKGVSGRQALKSVSGNVETDVGGTNLEIKTVSGDVTLHGTRGKPAEMRITTVSGNVTLPQGAGSLEGSTISGDIDVRLNPARGLRLRTTSGNLEFVGRLAPDASFDVETVSGDLSLRAASDKGYRYEVTTFSGDIENCFDAEAVETSRHGPGSRLAGTRGEGGASLRLKTMSGNVELCDR